MSIEQIADDFVEDLYERFGADGFEFDSYYINGTSDKAGIIVQLWLEWFGGSVMITQEANVEFDTLIFPRGQLSENQLPAVEEQLELFRREYPDISFTVLKNKQEDIGVYLDQYIVEFDSNNENRKVILMHLEKVCDIAKECYFKLKETIID